MIISGGAIPVSQTALLQKIGVCQSLILSYSHVWPPHILWNHRRLYHDLAHRHVQVCA
jgi:hypothetical protein